MSLLEICVLIDESSSLLFPYFRNPLFHSCFGMAVLPSPTLARVVAVSVLWLFCSGYSTYPKYCWVRLFIWASRNGTMWSGTYSLLLWGAPCDTLRHIQPHDRGLFGSSCTTSA